MTSSRNPDIKYNGSGYFDKTAYDAIRKVDRDMLKIRKKRVILKLKTVAREEGFLINSYVCLVELKKDKYN